MLTFNSAQWARSSRWLSFVMLVMLHLALWLGIDHLWARPLLLTHMGLFLMWQPLWRSEEKLSWGNSAFILAISLSALVWLNWWMLAFWVSGLFALVGGRVFTFYSRWQRAYYLLLMAYLLAVLLLYIAPHLFGLPAYEEVTGNLLEYGLPLLLLVMAVLPVEREPADNVQTVDFIYVLLLFTLLTLLVLGSLAFMTLGHVAYLHALLRTLFLLGIALFILGVLWNPRIGFTGLQAGFSRYVLSIGTPLEEWLKQIAVAAQQEQNPATFLDRATAYLAKMPSISGISWLSEEGHGTLGASSQHRVELSDEDLSLTLFTRQSISPTVLLHMRLLVQVLGHFYQAKRREQRLREMTRQQAIYETGSRLTHDLKNMLQSLFALTSVAQHDPARAQPILKHQLPVLTGRIETLLAKLKAPEANADEIEMPLPIWWETLRQRHQHREIEWVFEDAPPLAHGMSPSVTPTRACVVGGSAPYNHGLPLAGATLPRWEREPVRASSGFSPSPTGGGDGIGFPLPLGEGVRVGEDSPPLPRITANSQLIPAPMFDCVADNLIENASNKRLREPDIRITVRLNAEPPVFSVTDSGSAVPLNLAQRLLRTVLPSEDGLGVGLYQAARWAQQMGYRLILRENHAGNVRFELMCDERGGLAG